MVPTALRCQTSVKLRMIQQKNKIVDDQVENGSVTHSWYYQPFAVIPLL